METSSLVDRLSFSSETEMESGESLSDSDYESNSRPEQIKTTTTPTSSTLDKTRILYNAGVIVKNAIKQCPGMNTPWPPTSTDLNCDSAAAVVPVELYNFLAWCVGASDEPCHDCFVETESDSRNKLISICQDVVYLASNGRKQTPKSLCLGLTVRHLTGSSQLLTLLNKLGHSASVTSVIAYETSLAQLQLQCGLEIPAGFEKGKPTVLVWDNIDFGEETLSGRGTTHHTNGIMLQSKVLESRTTTRDISLKKGIRSIVPQCTMYNN
jgi:hypothetical protein